MQIDLIVRGICCLRPGLRGVSENIRVISIIGRFLEHSRAFCFRNGGQEEVYIGSADWMPRNLDRRIEAAVPILDPVHRNTVRDMLELMWRDNRQAWELQADGNYEQRRPSNPADERGTHRLLMDLARDGATPEPRSISRLPAMRDPAHAIACTCSTLTAFVMNCRKFAGGALSHPAP